MKMNPKKAACILTTIVLAGTTAMPVLAAAPKVKKAEYEGRGKVEIDFRSDVIYKNVKVTVKDQDGRSYKAVIVDKDSDDLDFRIKNFRCGKKYTYKITGIRSWNGTKNVTVKGTVKIPKAKTIKVKRIEIDREDSEVEFDFKPRVAYKNPKVTITDANGKKLKVRITDRDSDGLEVQVRGLKMGRTYKYKIKGIRNVDASKYRTLSGSFTV